jgi:hypothetical protein
MSCSLENDICVIDRTLDPGNSCGGCNLTNGECIYDPNKCGGGQPDQSSFSDCQKDPVTNQCHHEISGYCYVDAYTGVCHLVPGPEDPFGSCTSTCNYKSTAPYGCKWDDTWEGGSCLDFGCSYNPGYSCQTFGGACLCLAPDQTAEGYHRF